MKVIVADKKGPVRSALSLLLAQEAHFTVCAEASSEKTLRHVLATQTADLLLLDWALVTTNARSLIGHLKSHHPALVVVVLGGTTDDMQLAIDAGADAFISKSEAPQYVLSILNLVTNTHTTRN